MCSSQILTSSIQAVNLSDNCQIESSFVDPFPTLAIPHHALDETYPRLPYTPMTSLPLTTRNVISRERALLVFTTTKSPAMPAYRPCTPGPSIVHPARISSYRRHFPNRLHKRSAIGKIYLFRKDHMRPQENCDDEEEDAGKKRLLCMRVVEGKITALLDATRLS